MITYFIMKADPFCFIGLLHSVTQTAIRWDLRGNFKDTFDEH